MIDRYCYPEMKALWELGARFQKWLDVELAVCDAYAEVGVIPKEAAVKIRLGAHFTVERVLEIEREVDHDLIAFVKAVTENLGDEAKYVHLGMTSYDIEDTALGLILRDACDILLADIDRLLDVLGARAKEHKYTLMMGRTHGVHAEPITLGLKLSVWITEMRRNRRRIEQARETIRCGKLSGAVGTFANIDPRVEQRVCRTLGLRPAEISTQILQRDRHAEYLTALAIMTASLEKFAVEIRNLQRTDILEVEEPFRKGQRGSSAMPHKRNPIVCERITGLARVVRANAVAGLENVALWHERDLSNSGCERVILPDSSLLADYCLRKFADVMSGLVVYPERMRANIGRTRGVIFSQQVMLKLIEKGWLREKAYTTVQKHAMQSWETGAAFAELLQSDEEVAAVLSSGEIGDCMKPEHHLRHVDDIFERVGI